MTPATPVQLQRAARGLTEARARWEPTRLENTPDSMLIETTVVLWWLCALDELLAEQSPAYVADRDADPAHADLLLGLRHARNRLGHRLADAIVVSEAGMSFPLVFPLVFFELLWVGRDVVDAAGGRLGKPAGDAYERAVAGRLVRETVSVAATWMLARPELAPPS